MLTRARLAVLVLATLTLAACGSIHPGDAAVVDGKSVSMKSLDETAAVYCIDAAQQAAAQGSTEPENAKIRQQAVTAMVSLIVARELADENDITVKRSDYELNSEQKAQVAKVFTTVDLDDAVAAIEDSQELSLIEIALGEKISGEKVSDQNGADLVDLGQTEIVKAFKSHGVKFAPRFGLSANLKDTGTGSLSVQSVDFDTPTADELPAAQRCA